MLLLWLACAPPPEPFDGPPVDGCGDFVGVQADVYVDPQAPADGDGSRQLPLRELDEALGPDRRVALAPGRYPGLHIAGSDYDGLTLLGSCRDLVVIADGSWPVDLFQAGSITLESLVVEGGSLGAITAYETTLTLEKVRVLGGGIAAVALMGGHGEFRDLSIESADGIGMSAEGGTVDLQDLVIEGSLGVGLLIQNAVDAQLRGVVVRDTRPVDGALASGMGLYVIESQGSLVDVEVEGGSLAGLLVEASELSLDRVHLHGVGSDAIEVSYGLLAVGPAQVRGEDLLIESVDGVGILSLDSAVVELENSEIRDNLYGVEASFGGSITLSGSELRDNQDFGILSRGGSLRTQDTVVHGSAVGVYIQDGSGWLQDTQVSAVVGGIAVRSGELWAERVEVGPVSGSVGVRGIELADGSSGELLDVSIHDSSGYGLLVDGSRFVASRLRVEDIASEEEGFGVGIQLQNEGIGVGQDLLIKDVRKAGLVLIDSSLGGDLTVASVHQDQGQNFGFGVLAVGASSLKADVSVSRVKGAGVVLSGPVEGQGSIEIREVESGTVATTGFGLTLQEGASWQGEMVVESVDGPGLSVVLLGRAEGSLVTRDVAFAGLVVEGGFVDLSLDIDGVDPDASEGGGVGVFVDDGPHGAGSASLSGSVQGAPLAAVYLREAGDVGLRSCSLRGGEGVMVGEQTLHGDGVVALYGASLELDDCTIEGASTGVFLHGSGATLEGVNWEGNARDLLQQGCVEGMPPLSGVPEGSEICPQYDELFIELSIDSYLSEEALQP